MFISLKTIVAVCAAMTITVVWAPISASAATTTKPAKLIEVRTCPETGAKVVGDPAGFEVVGSYKVYFCCAGCQPQFDKLTKAQKLAKLAKLAKASK